jgi:Neprosin
MRNLARLGGTCVAAISAMVISGGGVATAGTTAPALTGPGLSAGPLAKTPPPDFAAGASAGTISGTGVKQQCDISYLRYGACYDYAGASQAATNQGATVSFPVQSPNVAWNNTDYGHSLMEMAVFNRTSTGIDEDTAEVGWTVQDVPSGKAPVPHLFVYHFVNTKGTCYNACGFVKTSKTIVPGMALKPGTNVTWSIRNIDSKWTFYFNGTEFGYIPDSAYKGTFGNASIVNVYGEIAGTGKTPACNQMGNTLYGSQPGAATIGDFQLYGASTPAGLRPYQPTDPAAWNSTHSANTFRVGGPGDCLGMAGTVPSGTSGYTVVGQDTSAYPFAAGQNPWSRPSAQPAPQVPGAGQIVGVATDPATGGYWMTDDQGDVYPVNAPSYGDLNGTQTPAPIVGITAFKSGYLLVTASGAVYGFHAPSYGGVTTSSPIVGIAAFKSGYLLAAANGSVYPVHTRGYGSAVGKKLASPITGIAADGQGYLLVSERGDVYAFHTANLGSLRGTPIPERIMGITPVGRGYVLTGAFGEVYAFHTRLNGSVTNEGF